MLTWILFAVAVMFAVANGCVLHSFADRGIRNTGDTFFFNGGVSTVWIVSLLTFSLVSSDLRFSADSLLYGMIYGVVICSFLLFKNLAVTSGPVSLTTLIGSCPFILTMLFGVLCLGQSINGYQIAGILLILVALCLCVSPQKGGMAFSAKWLIYCSLFFLAGGGVGITYMLFGGSDAATEINGMVLCAAVVATVLYFLVGTVLNAVKGQPAPKIHRSGWKFILLCGLLSCTYMRLNLYLSTVIPAVVFFPVSNGMNVILAAVAGRFLYRERLTRPQLVGIGIGLVAIILTGSGSTIAAMIFR